MGKLRIAVFALVALASTLAPDSAHAVFGPLGEDFRISFMGPNGNASYDANSSNVAYNPAANEYLVVWAGDDDAAPLVDEEFEVFAQRISADGTPIGGRVRVSDMGPDGDTIYDAFGPSVAYNSLDNQYLVSWTGDDNTAPLVDGELEIFAQRLTAAGAEVGANDFRVSDMGPDGTTAYSAAGASVVYNSMNDQYLVIWRGDDNTPPLVQGEVEIFGQQLTAGGAEVGANDFRISDMGPNGNGNYDGLFPSVAYNPADNQYLVTWEGDDNTAPLVDNEAEVFGQRLSSLGAEVGANDFRISDMGPDGDVDFGAHFPTVAYDSADKEYLVAWEGDDNTPPLVTSEVEVFGQRLTAAGAEVGANDFRISDMGPDGDPNYDIKHTRVAYNPSENQYLVTWDSDDNTAPLVKNEFEIFGQALDGSGAEVGPNDFRISHMGPDGDVLYQAIEARPVYNPAVHEYLVTWTGDDDTAPLVNDEFEIFGQRLADLPPPPAPPGGGPPSADTVAPQFLSLALSPRRFAAFRSGPSVRPARTRGTRVTYQLSEAAAATFRVQRVLPGRRVGARCVRPTRANRSKPRCKRYRTLRGRFQHAGAAGLNRFRFTGRLAGRKLRPGSYRLVATAKDAAANTSKPVRRPFRIIR